MEDQARRALAHRDVARRSARDFDTVMRPAYSEKLVSYEASSDLVRTRSRKACGRPILHSARARQAPRIGAQPLVELAPGSAFTLPGAGRSALGEDPPQSGRSPSRGRARAARPGGCCPTFPAPLLCEDRGLRRCPLRAGFLVREAS